VAVNQRFGDDG